MSGGNSSGSLQASVLASNVAHSHMDCGKGNVVQSHQIFDAVRTGYVIFKIKLMSKGPLSQCFVTVHIQLSARYVYSFPRSIKLVMKQISMETYIFKIQRQLEKNQTFTMRKKNCYFLICFLLLA